MAIIGLTDTVRAAFPTIGRLRKGGPAPTKDGKITKPGPDLQYFRFTSEQPEVVAAFMDAYGGTPALVRAYLPYPDVETNFSCWKEKWVAGGLVHRCDGRTMTIWLDDWGKYHRTPKPCEGGCDEVGRLALIIPELVRAGYVGYVTLQTTGLNDMLSIQASLMAAWASRAGNPLGLRGIQWNVRRVKEKISTPGEGGKRVRREKWMVKVEPAADWVQLQLEQAHATTMALPAPRAVERTVDTETGEIIDAVDDDYQDEEAEVEAQPEQPAETAAASPAPEATVQPANPTPASSKPASPNSPAMKGWQRVYKDSQEFGVEADTLAATATDQDVISATAVLRARIVQRGNEVLGEAAEMGIEVAPVIVTDWKTYGDLIEGWQSVRNS